ncbi:hypothetical protein TIFTF001_029971 [Ficus carica]|uniref:ethanolamine kinase n=1 Tax=Ficus carica TaxID=3494 RepID=A0AA88DTD8_FICCA|nr:hypothetical protein TIFTF001_029971 [Ficus carica]
MGALNIWNAMEVASEPSETSMPQIAFSSLSIDPSLSLPQISPRVMSVSLSLLLSLSPSLSLFGFRNWFFCLELFNRELMFVLKVSVKEENGDNVSVTVRLYGPNTDYVINRERELQAIKYLSAAGFGANLLAVFGNGMVQSFIYARTLTPLDICPMVFVTCDLPNGTNFLLSILADMKKPKLAAGIAKQLREFHQVEIPGSKEPQLWNDLFKFFEKASTLEFDDREKQRIYETIFFKEVHNEINELKELTDLFKAPVVFAHNDLLSGNIMLNEEEDKLYFIDFEYGSYNYRGYDIGNHFNEYAGFDCDFSLYPSKDEQYHFFRHYLQPDNPHEVSEKDIEALYVEANTYMLASHLYWALWGIIQAKISPIEFNYIGYFFLRYNEYKKQKEKSFSLARSSLSGSGTV